MKIQCPICKSPLMHKRCDDGFIIHEIDVSGQSITEVANKSNGYDQIYCSSDEDHLIPQELHDLALSIVDEKS